LELKAIILDATNWTRLMNEVNSVVISFIFIVIHLIVTGGYDDDDDDDKYKTDKS
jgi:hypothetical protein